MSFKQLGQIFDIPPEKFGGRSAKLLLLAITDRADEYGIAYPSRDDLRKRTGMSLSTITREARRLQNKGWLQRKQRFNTSTLYRINLGKIAQTSHEVQQARIAEKAVEWEPFEEEMTPQPVENKGEGHSDPTSGHGDTGSGHGDTGSGHIPTPNPPLNLPLNQNAALALDEYPEKVKEALRHYFNPVATAADKRDIESFLSSVGCSGLLNLSGVEKVYRFG